MNKVDVKLNIALATCLIVVLSACGGSGISNQTTPATQSEIASPQQSATEFPTSLPVDYVQAWEELGDNGFIIPGHGVSAVNGDSEFLPGVDREDQGGSVTDEGEASRMASGESGSGDVSYAMYRFPLGGDEPGVISVDINMRNDNDGSGHGYYFGVANYSRGSWDWHGPFRDSHTRLSVAQAVRDGSSFTSLLGSVYIAIVVTDGSAADVVSLGVNLFDGADVTAPPIPTGLTAVPHGGAIELIWNSVVAPDLAGYKVYHRDETFFLPTQQGIHTEEIQGRLGMLVTTGTGRYFAVSAIDISGNESDISSVVFGNPLPGNPPLITLLAESTSVMINTGVPMTATGADTYDWDLDGDGIFDVVGDVTGNQVIDTSSPGVIRPLVYGGADGGSSVAMAAVSVIVSSNARPVVQGFVDPAFGPAPLTVDFTSNQVDVDGSVVEYIWDFTSNGVTNFRFSTAGGLTNPAPYTFTTPGVYNAKVRAWDDDGAWDVDTVTIVVEGNQLPVAELNCVPSVVEVGETIYMYGDSSFDPDGSIVEYEWDTDADGSYETSTGTTPITTTYFNTGGYYELKLRVRDDGGDVGYATLTVTVGDGWVQSPNPDDTVKAGTYNSMAIVNGNPAIAYLDDTNFDLLYVRANDENGATWGTPVVVVVSPQFEGYHNSMIVVNGNPAIAYYNSSTGNNFYVRATDVNGATWGAPVALDNSGSPTGLYNSMEIVDGRPAIAWYNQLSHDLWYSRSDDVNGDVWTTHVGVDITPGDKGKYASLEVIDGKPGIAYWDDLNNDLLYAYSNEPSGMISWSLYNVVVGGDDVGEYCSLLEVDGRPAISYYEVLPGDDLMYIRADNSGGTAWTATPIEVSTGGATGMWTSMAIVNGHPAIGHHRPGGTCAAYIRSLDAHGNTWPISTTIFTPPSGSSEGTFANLIMVNGQPAMSYFHSNGAEQWLRYIRLY